MATAVTAVSRRFLQFLIVLIALAYAPAWAATFTVNSTLDAVDAKRGDGICETAAGNGVCTLRAAIQESNALAGPDTIVLPAGTYTIAISPTTSTDATGSFDIRSDLSIVGAGSAVTIADGGGLDAVFASIGNLRTINISGLTIQNGNVGAFIGAGLFAQGTNNVTLTDVVIQNNHAGQGGGIYNRGTLTLIRSTVQGNTATHVDSASPRGGGIYNALGVVTLKESTIRDNTASFGGGLYNAATMVIEASTINGNIATNTTLNNGDGGGGIVNGNDVAGTMTVTNSTISGNRAYSHFGGIYNANGNVTLNSVTITDNRADADGDGFGNAGGLGLGNSASATLRNTLLAGNGAAGSAPDCFSLNAAAITSGGYNLIGNTGATTDCVFTAAAGDQLGTVGSPLDARLNPLTDNSGSTFTHGLMDGSPAIDAGDPAGCTDGTNALSTDQRGVPRVIAGGSGVARCDVGAYELIRPVAVAGPDQRVNSGVVVLLDGSASAGWAGVASYVWTQMGGVPIALTSASTATTSFTAPSVAGVVTLRLTVTDRYGVSASDTVDVSVNAAPIADAGPDQIVNAGASVTMNGTASRDPDGLIMSYAWTQTGGSAIMLTGADTAMPSFIAPATAGPVTLQLVVTDNEGATHADSVTVTIVVPAPAVSTNKPPVANAGRDEDVYPRSIVMLNGWKSYDPDGRIVSYRWVQTGGTPVQLYGASWRVAMFVAPKAEGRLTFQLTVTDDKGASNTDTVRVTVDDCKRGWWHRLFEWRDDRHDCR